MNGRASCWLDRDVEAGESYAYWLEVSEGDGRVERFGPTEAVVVPFASRRPTLDEPWPNPASHAVSVEFELADAQTVTLSVYDLAGRLVTTLQQDELAAGRHRATWDCAGEAAGAYLLRLEAGDDALSRRIVVGR